MLIEYNCNMWMLRIICLCILIALFSSGGAVTAPAQETEQKVQSWWPQGYPAPDTPLDHIVQNRAKTILGQLQLPDNASFHEKTDAVRHFIASHSVLKMDAEFYSYWFDLPYVMEKMIEHAKGETDERRPHTACGVRTAIMHAVLKEMGIKSRTVIVYTDRQNGDNTSHAYLEAFNPFTEKWEIEDPTNNYFWAFRDTEKRASTEDLLSHHVSGTFMSCRTERECSSLKETDDIIDYFSMAAVLNVDERYGFLLVNYDRFRRGRLFEYVRDVPIFCGILDKPCLKGIVNVNDKKS
jgi:hypothetical protein